MTVLDYLLIAVAVALVSAIAWHRTQARAVGELWWSCVCLAGIICLKIGVIARPFNRLTGGIYLDELVGHLLGVVIAALTMSWLVLVRTGSRQPFRTVRHLGTAGVLAVLVATWFAGPVYDIPADSVWIPDAVNAAPVILVHWLVFQAYLLAFAVVFALGAGSEARRLPPGYVRVSLTLLIGASALLAVCFAIGLVGRALVIAGQPFPDAVLPVQNALLAVVFALFLIAVAIPLVRRGRRAPDGGTTGERVASLWTWIHEANGDDPPRSAASTLDPAAVLLDQVVDIRDRIWLLQRFVGPDDVAEAARRARVRGLLFGSRARADVLATCLHLAARRRAEQRDVGPPPRANLARLGGGRSIAQEAHWLAAVADAVEAHVRRTAVV